MRGETQHRSVVVFNEALRNIVKLYTQRTHELFEAGMWFTNPKRLLFLTTSRVFSLYKSQCLREGDKPMPESTVEYYLKNSLAFVCETQKESFKKIDPTTNMQEQSESGEKKRTSTTALIFDIDKTGLSIGDQDNSEKEEIAKPIVSNGLMQPGLPF